MTRTDDLMAMMQRHMQRTAFVFTRTAKGISIDLDVMNPRWWETITRTNLNETASYQIVTDAIDSKFTIVETTRYIDGENDRPRFSASPTAGIKQSLRDEVDLHVSAELVRREAGGLGFRETIDRRKLSTMLRVLTKESRQAWCRAAKRPESSLQRVIAAVTSSDVIRGGSTSPSSASRV